MTDRPTTTIPGPGTSGFSEPDSDTRPTRRPLVWNGATDVGLLILRFAVGGTFVAHGMQKVFGMWGGPGIAEFARMLDQHGYQETTTLSWLTGVTEVVAGAFVVLGVFTPLAAAALLSIKINALLIKLGFGFFITAAGSNAIELDVVLGLSAAAIVLTGPGRIALDNGRPWHRRPAAWGVLALIIGVAVGLLVYVFLHRADVFVPVSR
jgi:putative oxidoreductase